MYDEDAWMTYGDQGFGEMSAKNKALHIAVWVVIGFVGASPWYLLYYIVHNWWHGAWSPR